MTGSLRVALVVPDTKYAWDDERQFRLGRLKERIRGGDIDLVVFPEAYDSATRRDAQASVDAWADELNAPVLMGLWVDDAFQTAGFRNPKPRRGDTSTHLYVKHSTSKRLAYEWPHYARVRDAMFEPITLKGTKFGVQLCHEMFFGLIGARLHARGATALIDLTGGGVNLSKWTNVIHARSLELGGPFLCTMSCRPGDGGAATAIGYTRGRPMQPTADTTRKDGAGGFTVFDLAHPGQVGEDASAVQSFSDKRYDDIVVSLGSAVAPSAHVSLSIQDRDVRASGARPTKAPRPWQGFATRAGTLGVLILPLDALYDALSIHREEPPAGTFDHHLVVYGGRSDADAGEVMALLRLRAIEHRVAVAVLTPTLREVVKTNRYKNIQRMKETNGVFGLDANFLGGTFEGARDGTLLGIPQRFMPQYRALLEA